MSKLALVTGTNGAIGAAIVKKLHEVGYRVCGIDCAENLNTNLDNFIQVDLNEFVNNENVRNQILVNIKVWLDDQDLDILVNNAAYQYVSNNHPMPPEEFLKSYAINLLAPYLLITNLAPYMKNELGSVVNIGSIHSKLTKPGFVAYATSKAALSSLTKGLAIDFGARIKINCIEPASVETPMLIDGFKKSPNKKVELENYHPQKKIGTPEEIAEMVLLISSSAVKFLHGACIEMSGGISSRLHDPV